MSSVIACGAAPALLRDDLSATVLLRELARVTRTFEWTCRALDHELRERGIRCTNILGADARVRDHDVDAAECGGGRVT
jgi:hypothetical protein